MGMQGGQMPLHCFFRKGLACLVNSVCMWGESEGKECMCVKKNIFILCQVLSIFFIGNIGR
jgi:hypothetical protein